MSRRRKIVLGLVVAAIVVFAAIVILPRAFAPRSTTFRVTVPASTPVEDTIVLHIELDLHPMTRVAPGVYETTVDISDLDFTSPNRYGYSRGGFSVFGEYGFGVNVGGRTFVPRAEALKEDTVTEWRWFPTTNLSDPAIASEAQTRPIAPRPRFWAGPDLVDFWNPTFVHQFNSTIAHLKAQGYEWIQLDPPWDYASTDPPVIANAEVAVPSWTLDELRNEVRTFKAAGFKVFLGPQVCCAKVSFDGRPDAWWRAWYDQYEHFVQAHADLAREEGVDAFAIGGAPETMPGERRAPAFAQEGWDRILAAARSSGAPIGINMHPPVRDGQNLHEPWPPEAVQFATKVDFVSLGMWEWVVDRDDPSLAEIEAGFDEVFRRVDHAHNLTGKPLVLAQVAYFSEHSAARPKGAEVFPTWGDPHANATRYDPLTQALIYESLMRHVAGRPHIEGLFPFGYYYVSAPLNLDSDIRDKPAERIFTYWLERFSQE